MPIRTIQQQDHLTTYSFAYCIALSEETGFDWFFNEYLNGEIPLIHFHTKLASEILSQFFLIKNFNFKTDQISRLENLFKLNIAFSTSLCFELLPTLALIESNAITINQRCLLLSSLLNDDVLRFKSEEILK